MTSTEYAQILLRSAAADDWTADDPTPGPGEPCWEADTGKLKIGDGVTPWTSLDYFAASPGGGGGGGGGAPIGEAIYNPGTRSEPTTSSSSLVDVDATHLAVTFTPTGTSVWVTLETAAAMSGGLQSLKFGLRNGSTQVGTVNEVAYNTAAALRHTTSIKVTGLTAGTSYTLKWAWSTTGSATFYSGGASGPSTMRVFPA